MCVTKNFVFVCLAIWTIILIRMEWVKRNVSLYMSFLYVSFTHTQSHKFLWYWNWSRFIIIFLFVLASKKANHWKLLIAVRKTYAKKWRLLHARPKWELFAYIWELKFILFDLQIMCLMNPQHERHTLLYIGRRWIKLMCAA